VVESGQSTEELSGDPLAAKEMRGFCDFVHRFAFPARSGRMVLQTENEDAA
jgi:hypothetical protein